MLQKGTENYKKAQEIAFYIESESKNGRNDDLSYELSCDRIARFLVKVKETNTFASKIAETIEKNMDTCTKQVAYISDKQAWILACCAVENKIEYYEK